MVDHVPMLIANWLLTYLVHSTVLLAGSWFVAERLRLPERTRELVWRTGMLGALATATAAALGLPDRVMGWFQSSTGLISRAPVGALTFTPDFGSAHALVQGAATAGVLLWLAIALADVALLARGHRRLAVLLRARMPAKDHALAWKLGSAPARYRVTVARGLSTPLALGTPEICLPERALREFSPEELAAVVAHEAAHLDRHDPRWRLVIALVERILFLQPLNRVAGRRLRGIAEFLCDERAARSTSPLAVASALANVAEWVLGAPNVVAVGMAGESLALQRITRILGRPVDRASRPGPLVVFAGAVALLALTGPGVGLRAIGGPSVPYTITAFDDGGPFTVTLERGRILGATMAGEPVPNRLIRQDGDRVRIGPVSGQGALNLTLTATGGLSWSSRRAITSLP